MSAIHPQQFRNSLVYLAKWVSLSVLIGILAGSASAVFLIALQWVGNYRGLHPWLIWFLPLAGLLIGLLYHYLGKRSHEGNRLLLDTIHEPREKIPFRMAPLVLLGTLTTHLFGGSAGREGTALQMSGAIADQFSKPFRLSREDRSIFLMAAIAAGFGSVFGTALAGAVFALEVHTIGRIRYHALLPAFASSIIATLVCNQWPVVHTHYHIPDIPAFSVSGLALSLIAGMAFGATSFLFTKGMHDSTRLFQKMIPYAPLRPVAGGMVLALAFLLLQSTRYAGLGIPIIEAAFQQQQYWYDFALKALFTILTLSADFKGGEVTPLFFIGALLGNTLSLFIPLPMGLLTGMGFVAVFAGATHTPIACTIMAMELFGSEAGVYAAVACISANYCAGKQHIYGGRK